LTHASRLCLAVAAILAGAPLAAQSPPSPAPAATPEPVFLKPGEIATPFDAEGLDGVKRHVDFPKGTVTVLFFLSAGCPHCHRMIPVWNKWVALRPPNVAMVGVLVDREPPGFFDQIPIGFPLLRSPGRELMEQYKVSRVPLTLRIAAGGKVEEVGAGELDEARLFEIFRK
jgi:thiol-disulfide isomerase/thioredoxin